MMRPPHPSPGRMKPARKKPQQSKLRWLNGHKLLLCAVLVAALYLLTRSGAHQSSSQPRDPKELAVWWHAPFFSPSGYGTEAVDFVLGLDEVWPAGVWITQHGDSESEEVYQGFSKAVQRNLVRMATQPMHKRASKAIIICHSEPGAWSVPRSLYSTSPCPPEPVGDVPYAIGRTMFESDRVSEEHARRMNAMDEVWVPTQWQREVFSKWGVAREKLVVMPEAVDTALFDPDKHKPLPLPLGTLVFGPPRAKHGGVVPSPSELDAGSTSSSRLKKFMHGINWRRALHMRVGGAVGMAGDDGSAGAAAAQGGSGADLGAHQQQQQQGAGQQAAGPEPFVFLSSFKWEARKGWDVLLEAYLTEFSASDNVMLVLMTKPFYTDTDFAAKMRSWAAEQLAGLEFRTGGLANAIRVKGGGSAASASAELGGLLGVGGGRSLQGGEGGAAAAGSADASAASRAPFFRSLPTVYVLHEYLPGPHMPRLYKSADCFVIASRGEGWGRPHVEAMSMGLPLIATNWSGPTAYLDEGVGYPLRIDGLVDTPPGSGAFEGHRWAQPSVQHLRQLLRQVMSRPEEAAAKGRAARERMQSRYSPLVVARQVADRLAAVHPRRPRSRGGRGM